MVEENYSLADIAAANAGFWAVHNKIKLQSDVFSFDRRKYQNEIMKNEVRRVCYMKATQGGFSEMEVLKTLWGLIHKVYRRGVLYMFPSTDDVLEFGKSRFSPLIQNNPRSIGKYVKPGGAKGTDTSSLKKIHDAFLYLRGARITQSADGTGAGSSKLSGIPVDRCVFDEVDLMDDEVIQKALGRMGDSDIKEEVYIANPRIPGAGIDAIFQQSDQRHLFRKCSCGEYTCAELSFPECVHIREDGTGYIACQKCGKPVGLHDVQWIPQRLDKNITIRGYRWSQLSSMTNDPGEILEQVNNPPQGNLSDVYRLRLGLPHVSSENMLTIDRVYECCSPNMMATYHEGPCAMGVDIGKKGYIVIGIRTGKGRYEILKIARIDIKETSDWNQIHDLAQKFNVKSAVIDIRPYEDSARTFQKAESYRIYLCEYNENSVNPTNYNDNTGIVSQNRTEICDMTHRIIEQQDIKLPRRSPEMKVFANQLCSIAKILEKNKKSGIEVYRYQGTNDHYRHALNYFVLAAKGSKIATVAPHKKRQQYAINEARCA